MALSSALPTRRSTRRVPDDIAQRLMESLPEVFEESVSFSVDHVARVANIPRATLYYYFGGKEDLVGFFLSWLNEHVQARIAESAAGRGTIRERLERALLAGVTIGSETPHLYAAYLTVLTETGMLGPGLIEMGERGLSSVKDLLGEAKEAGILRVADAEMAHNILWGTCVMVFLKALVHQDRSPAVKELRATVAGVLDALLDAEPARPRRRRPAARSV